MTLLANNGFRKQLSVCVGSNIHGRCSVRPAELLRVRVASVSPFQIKMLCLFMPAPSLCRSAHGILATIFDADFGGLEYFRCHEQWPVGRGGNVLKNSMFPRVCTWSADLFFFACVRYCVCMCGDSSGSSPPLPPRNIMIHVEGSGTSNTVSA